MKDEQFIKQLKVNYLELRVEFSRIQRENNKALKRLEAQMKLCTK